LLLPAFPLQLEQEFIGYGIEGVRVGRLPADLVELGLLRRVNPDASSFFAASRFCRASASDTTG
jgi:hypothetical protein